MLLVTWKERNRQNGLAPIVYKNGVTQTELAEWYNVQRRPIYSWLTQLDTDESLEQAVTNIIDLGENETSQKRGKIT